MAQIDKPNLHFNTKLYTGTGSTQSITGVGFQPDWVWIKARSIGYDNNLFDAVRGTEKRLRANDAPAQDTVSGSVTAFGTDGFTVGADAGVNANSETFASWNWKANGAGSANSDGTLASTVSVNTAAGISLVKYTGNGSSGATVGHGLGAKPDVIILKSYENGQQWAAYWEALGATKYMRFNTTNAVATSAARWNDTEPTTSVFTIGNDGEVNTNTEDHIAYCFSEKKGFSKFGKYDATGTSSDGPFIYTGFPPAFVMIKRYNSTENWYIFDDTRDTANPIEAVSYPNLSNADGSLNGGIDLLSNGFKIRNSNSAVGAGDNYIFMAFAAQPLVGTNNIPAVAR